RCKAGTSATPLRRTPRTAPREIPRILAIVRAPCPSFARRKIAVRVSRSSIGRLLSLEVAAQRGEAAIGAPPRGVSLGASAFADRLAALGQAPAHAQAHRR